jgi:hypothetical protein
MSLKANPSSGRIAFSSLTHHKFSVTFKVILKFLAAVNKEHHVLKKDAFG